MAKRSVYQLKVILQDSKPPVWRRIQVNGDMTLARLHHVLQKSMGWKDEHLHRFIIGDKIYNDHAEEPVEYVDQTLDEKNFRLTQLLPQEKTAFSYEYDFGDEWRHEVTVEKIIYGEHLEHPICLDGQHACPPEDIGGIPGYEEFLAALRDFRHPSHEEVKKWTGGAFDAAQFDVTLLNRSLKKIK